MKQHKKMEQETLFTASKWDILKVLSSGSKSPIQLAKVLNTSVANISQQLRLLDMAGLVQSKRISNRDKGQPRLLYSLAGNHSFLISTSHDFVEKKLFQLSDYNKIILRIWFIDQPELHYFIEKAFWHLEEHLEKINALYFNTNNNTNNENQINLVINSDDSSLKKLLNNITIKNKSGISKSINFDIKTDSEIKKILKNKNSSNNLYTLYDSSSNKNDLEDKSN